MINSISFFQSRSAKLFESSIIYNQSYEIFNQIISNYTIGSVK